MSTVFDSARFQKASIFLMCMKWFIFYWIVLVGQQHKTMWDTIAVFGTTASQSVLEFQACCGEAGDDVKREKSSETVEANCLLKECHSENISLSVLQFCEYWFGIFIFIFLSDLF